jgi:hypothetical protein
MLHVILCFDRPGQMELRQATRPAHLAYLETLQSRLVEVGPQLDIDGRPCGSMLLVETADRAEAEAIAAADPYAKAGLFESTLVRGFRTVFHDGKKVG